MITDYLNSILYALKAFDLYNAKLLEEYAIQFFICFSIMFLTDKLLAPKKARWYFIHVIMNAIVTIYALPDVWLCLSDPKNCYSSSSELSTTVPWIVGLAGHMYHVIAFSDIRQDDYIHHILMFPFAGISGMLYVRKPGFNMALFALTGLPGGIDYLLLTLVKLGYIDRYTEKWWNVKIQVWLRMPLLIFSTGIIYPEIMSGALSLWCLVGVGLSYWNGIFYMHDTVSNFYHKHYETVLALWAESKTKAKDKDKENVQNKDIEQNNEIVNQVVENKELDIEIEIENKEKVMDIPKNERMYKLKNFPRESVKKILIND